MVFITNRFVILCIFVIYTKKISTSPTQKFSFKKTFKSPQENYESRIAKLDDCEILERSGFSSEEDDDKAPPPKPKDEAKVVANAEIHVRFGCDCPSSKTKDEKDTHLPLKYPTCFHQPYVPYHPFSFVGCPFEQAQPHCGACLRPFVHPGWPNPCYHPGYPHLAAAALQCDDKEVNTTEEPPTTCATTPITKKKGKLPPIYCLDGKKCKALPNWEDIHNKEASELTDEELAAIGDLFDGVDAPGGGCSTTESPIQTKTCPTSAATIQITTTEPTRTVVTTTEEPTSPPTTESTPTRIQTTPTYHSTTITAQTAPTKTVLTTKEEPTSPPTTGSTPTTIQTTPTYHCTTTTTTEEATHSSTTTQAPVITPGTVQTTSTSACPTCCPIKPVCTCMYIDEPCCDTHLEHDVQITKVQQSPPCQNCPISPNCLILSDKVQFLRVNISCRCEEEECPTGRKYDIGDLYKYHNCPISANQAYHSFFGCNPMFFPGCGCVGAFPVSSMFIPYPFNKSPPNFKECKAKPIQTGCDVCCPSNGNNTEFAGFICPVCFVFQKSK